MLKVTLGWAHALGFPKDWENQQDQFTDGDGLGGKPLEFAWQDNGPHCQEPGLLSFLDRYFASEAVQHVWFCAYGPYTAPRTQEYRPCLEHAQNIVAEIMQKVPDMVDKWWKVWPVD